METADGQTTGEELNRLPSDEVLGQLQLTTLLYYLHESNPINGLIRDKTDPRAPSSIAATGLGLATVPVLVERGVISREFAPELVLKRLRFFRDSPQGPQPDATGYRGFYYHFLDMKTGRRVWQCELSTIDSAFLFAGMLTCAAYFDGVRYALACSPYPISQPAEKLPDSRNSSVVFTVCTRDDFQLSTSWRSTFSSSIA